MWKNFVCFSILLLQLNTSLTAKKILDVAKLVEEVNKNTNLPWKADSYGYSEVDVDLLAKTKLGLNLTQKNESIYKNSSPRQEMNKARYRIVETRNMNLPVNFTWANKTITKCPIYKIRDQSNCGSCWAVATAAALGDRYCLKHKANMTTPLSHEYMVACDKSNWGCFGGYMHFVNNFMVFNGTITGGEYDSDEGCQPYSIRPCGFPRNAAMSCDYDYSLNPKCQKRKCNNDWYNYTSEPNSNLFKASSWVFVKSNSSYTREDRIREEIHRNGPVTAAFYVTNDFMYYKSGVYVPSRKSWRIGGHAVRVVGWGVEKGLKYWHVANSWTTHWGERGFFKILRGVDILYFESQVTAFSLP